MKALLKGSAGVVALLAGAGLALAQQDAPAPDMAPMAAADITCAEIVDLDEMEFERSVYFLAGIHHAQERGFAAAEPGADPMQPDDDVAAAPEDPMETDDDVAAAPEDPLETDDDVAAAPEDPLETDDDVAAAPEDPMETDEDIAAADPGVDPGVTGAIGTLGMPDIQIEQIRTGCQDAPDQRVMDVLAREVDFAQ